MDTIIKLKLWKVISAVTQLALERSVTWQSVMFGPEPAMTAPILSFDLCEFVRWLKLVRPLMRL